MRLRRLINTPSQLGFAAGRVRALYDAGEIERRVLTGSRIYEPGQPMSIELQNVSFTYPGATRPSLVDVSFKIESGQSVTVRSHLPRWSS